MAIASARTKRRRLAGETLKADASVCHNAGHGNEDHLMTVLQRHLRDSG